MQLIPDWLGDDTVVRTGNGQKWSSVRAVVTMGTGQRAWEQDGAMGGLGL